MYSKSKWLKNEKNNYYYPNLNIDRCLLDEPEKR